uniref:Uncharacterized protein n=1 Tax=Nelumbo nucifera TaxID=4432 RepID=A0A822XQI0_NELNU|nr:TPA_asm: hypothetical protein HUJ06_022874 [Nelumbo nucifera]
MTRYCCNVSLTSGESGQRSYRRGMEMEEKKRSKSGEIKEDGWGRADRHCRELQRRSKKKKKKKKKNIREREKENKSKGSRGEDRCCEEEVAAALVQRSNGRDGE